MPRLSLLVVSLLLCLTARLEAVLAEGEHLNVPTVSCDDGVATVNFSWQPAADAAAQWLDLSIFDNEFAAGTFLAAGPLGGSVSGFRWSGIRLNTRHFFRINSLSAAGWTASTAGEFVASCLPPEADLGGRDAPFSLYPGLYVLDIDTGDLRLILDQRESFFPNAFYRRTFDWAPEGGRLAVASGRQGLDILRPDGALVSRVREAVFGVDWLESGSIGVEAERAERSGVMLLDPATGMSGAFWPDFYASASWSPDGRYLAHARQRARQLLGLEDIGLYVLDTASGDDRKLADGEFGLSAWSPDGSRLAAIGSTPGSDDSALFVITSGEEPVRLLAGNNISWSPNGRWIASTNWPAFENSSPEIWLQTTDGSFAYLLTLGESPTWSPDSQSVAFTRDGALWVIDVATRQEGPLVRPQLPVIVEPRWSPDGSAVAFRARGGEGGLYVIGAGGGAERYLAPGSGGRWSPDGDRLAFLFGEGGTGFGGAIYTMRPDASQVRRLATVFYSDAVAPCTSGPYFDWAPDGSSLAFWRHSARGELSLFIVGDLEGAQPVPLGRGYGPRWSPDGARLAYTGAKRFPCEARIVERGGGENVVLGAGLVAPTWSPGGDLIAAQSMRTIATVSGPRVLILDAANGARRGDLAGTGPVWAPDGKHLTFSRPVYQATAGPIQPPGALYQLVIARSDGSESRVLLEATNLTTYAWSPDGKHIAYSAYEEPGGGRSSIFVIEADGNSTPRRLTTGRDPTWSPDGSSILFSR